MPLFPLSPPPFQPTRRNLHGNQPCHLDPHPSSLPPQTLQTSQRFQPRSFPFLHLLPPANQRPCKYARQVPRYLGHQGLGNTPDRVLLATARPGPEGPPPSCVAWQPDRKHAPASARSTLHSWKTGAKYTCAPGLRARARAAVNGRMRGCLFLIHCRG